MFTVGGVQLVLAGAPVAVRMERAEAACGGVVELGETIVADEQTLAVYATARRVAVTPATVLLHGETGAGKEVLAEQIHRWSPRSGGPFVRLNCAALTESLLESELFGHERGAFTGADRRKPGLFAVADRGTLLLDEIGELSPATQAKLLRAIETRTIQPVGATAPVAVDVRILCATHRDLSAAVRSGAFREDLYYRISAFVLTLPPLRDRPSELVLLAERFAHAFSARAGRAAPGLSAEALACIQAYRWPGNVRELRNAIEHAVVMCDGPRVEKRHLPKHLVASPARTADRGARMGVRDELAEVERERIVAALDAHGGNRTRAAQMLGLSRRALQYKMHRHGIA
jgi:transcriptional regulator with PAS, ATPase and Fis domain